MTYYKVARCRNCGAMCYDTLTDEDNWWCLGRYLGNNGCGYDTVPTGRIRVVPYTKEYPDSWEKILGL